MKGTKQAKITEIFKSMQGEGIYQEVPQVFIRFYGCNLQCSYCDTDSDSCKEMTVDEVIGEVSAYSGYHSAALTGGEPLCQIAFLNELARALKKRGDQVYLETNGILPDELKTVIDAVDIVAMDIKLSSATGRRAYWDEHRQFLEIASQKDVFVKAIVTKDTQLGDLSTAVSLIHAVNKDIPLVLQPNFFELGSDLEFKINWFLVFARKHLTDVRMRGQLHKVMNWR